MYDPQFPLRYGLLPAPHALFRSSSTTLDGLGNSQLEKRPLNILKEIHLCMNRRQSILSRSGDEKDEILASMFFKNLGHPL